MSRTVWLAALVVAVVGGCGAGGPEDVSSAWSEPQWMGDQARRQEQFVVDLQACMDARGWHLTVDGSAGFVEPFGSMAEAERAGADRDACLVEQGVDTSVLTEPLTEEALRLMYRYDVDTYECLLAHDVELEDRPPSADRYVEEGLATQSGDPLPDQWWPYGDPRILVMEQEQVEELRRVCPERWTFASLS